MDFNEHSKLKNKHAFLSPSNYHWLNYTDDKLVQVYRGFQSVARGTELHELAAKCIKLGVKLPASRKTLNMYVNDAIGYNMIPEQILYYSDNCFGTADSISFSRKKLLRIHDLKTGSSKASMHQLEIYAGIFCLEYSFDPSNIDMELRIYQNDEVDIYNPPADDVAYIMSKIISYDRIVEELKREG